MFEIKDQDLAALQAIHDAMMACNAADTTHLHYQHGGTYGFMHDGFIDAATAIFTADAAHRLMELLVYCGEDVAYCLNLLRKETCPVCQAPSDKNHCYGCGVCRGKLHTKDCDELICQGHEELGPMGITDLCDGKCRPARVTTASC